MTAATLGMRRQGQASERLGRFLASGGAVWLLVIALVAVAALVSEDFRTERNLANLSRQAVVLSRQGAATVAHVQALLAAVGARKPGCDRTRFGIDRHLGGKTKSTAVHGAESALTAVIAERPPRPGNALRQCGVADESGRPVDVLARPA